jgi:hypothetical protein
MASSIRLSVAQQRWWKMRVARREATSTAGSAMV